MPKMTRTILEKLIAEGFGSPLKQDFDMEEIFIHRKFPSKTRQGWEYDTYLLYGGKSECDCFPFLKKGTCKHIESLVSELDGFGKMLWLHGIEIKKKFKKK